MKKFLSVILTLTLVLATSTTTAFASEVSEPGQATSSAVLTTEAVLLNVTTSTSVMIHVTAAGDVITPDNVQITNNSPAPIVVSSLAVIADGGWTLDSADTDYIKFKVGRNNFSMTLNGLDPSAGALSLLTPINGSSSLALDLWADVSPQKEAITATKIGEIVVTVDWYADTTPIVPPEGDGGTGESYPAGYALATDADFSGDTDGSFRYIGTDEYVVIPDVIKGVAVTSYRIMFADTDIKGIISDNPNITTTEEMFADTTADSLEISLNGSSLTDMRKMFNNSAVPTVVFNSIDTANVTDMQSMFNNAAATTLDLSLFNTSSVQIMTGMFNNSDATTLNLSSFITSSVVSMQNMFNGSQATVLDLSNFDTTNVAQIGGMFKSCAAKSIDLSSFNTSKVTNLGSMFTGSKVEVIDLSNFDTSKVVGMLDMFKDSEAKTINFGTNFDTSKVTYMSSMFAGCKAETLDLSSFTTSQVTNFSNMFAGCTAQTIDLSSFKLYPYPSPNIASMFADCAATTVFVQSQEEVTKLSDYTTDKPETLTFTIK